MSQTQLREELTAEELRRRAEEWFAERGGHEELVRALEQADAASRAFREAAAVDPKVLEQPMTV